MALNERQRARLRAAVESLLRAEDAVAEVADDLARTGVSDADAELDRAAALIREVLGVMEVVTRPS